MSSIKPLVSIISLTYNQESYVKQAIEGFVFQETDFTYEIIIADDGSSDGTREIIQGYEEKYPHLFKNRLRRKNIGAVKNLKDALKHARGKYIALCEGDDFWTDQTKLQKQIDFLENNPNYALCFHPVRVFFEEGEKEDEVFPSAREKEYSVSSLLKANFIQTNSVIYRAQNNYDKLAEDVMPYDWYLHLFHAQFGKIGFIDKTMSAYRRHQNGMWWGTSQSGSEGAAFMRKYFRPHIKLFEQMRNMFGQDAVLLANIDKSETNLVKLAVSLNINDIPFLQDVAHLTPRIAGEIINDMHNLKIAEQHKVEELNLKLLAAEQQLDAIKHRYATLARSVSFRVGRIITLPIRSLKNSSKD